MIYELLLAYEDLLEKIFKDLKLEDKFSSVRMDTILISGETIWADAHIRAHFPK